MTITRDSFVTWGGAAESTPTSRGGRPRAAAPVEVQVSSRLTTADYDHLVTAANQRGLSVAAFVRTAILVQLRPRR